MDPLFVKINVLHSKKKELNMINHQRHTAHTPQIQDSSPQNIDTTQTSTAP